MNLSYLKRFFSFFLLTYFIILSTKFLFLIYLYKSFQGFTANELIYAVLWGYKFDFSASAIVVFFITLFDFNKKLLAWVGSFLLVSIFFLQMGDILYFVEAGRHIGYEISDTFTDANSLFRTAYSQHTLFTIFSLSIGFILFFVTFKWFMYFKEEQLNRWYMPKKLFIIFLSIFFIRGMFQHIPLNPWQSNQIGSSQLATLALNDVYNIIYVLVNSSDKLVPIKVPNVDKKRQKEAFSYLYHEKNREKKLPILTTKPNIVLLFLESWSAVNMKSYGYNKTTTPFFDEILEKSIRPLGMIAGGHRTTEGIFSVVTSFQNPLGRSIAQTNLQDFSYTSLIKLLKQKGAYASAFFQGSSKETSGTGSLAQDLGFTESYGKRDVKERQYEENSWGIHDPDLYHFTLKKLDSMKKPFVIGINGATTHDDKIPKAIKALNLSEDASKNKILNALHFSDRALKAFVQEVQVKYPNTVFVFFADHCGGVEGDAFENYLIPFALYAKDLKAKKYDTFLSQRDIAPTLYDLVLGDYKKENINFAGKSLFSDNRFFADYYHNGLLGWVEGDKILELNIATKKSRCAKIVNFKDEEIECEDDMLNFKQRALSFTQTSQKFLFSGETYKFKNYK